MILGQITGGLGLIPDPLSNIATAIQQHQAGERAASEAKRSAMERMYQTAEERREARAEAERREAKEEKAAKIAAMVFCGEGEVPNPAFLNVPVEGRAQALAAGIAQCIPAKKKAGAITPSTVYFKVGDRRYSATQEGFERAVAAAQQDAQAGRANVPILRVGKRSITLTACATPGGGVQAVGVQLPTAIPATQGAGGVFTCPPGLEIARDAQNRVVCSAPGAAKAEAGGGGGRKGKGRKGHKGKKGRLHGLGSPYGSITAAFLERAGRGPSIPDTTYLRYPPAYQSETFTKPTNYRCPPGSILWKNPSGVPMCVPLADINAGNTHGLANYPQQVANRLSTYGRSDSPTLPQFERRQMPPQRMPTMPAQLAGLFR